MELLSEHLLLFLPVCQYPLLTDEQTQHNITFSDVDSSIIDRSNLGLLDGTPWAPESATGDMYMEVTNMFG